MSGLKLPKEKHLTLEAREEIQACLEHGVTFKAIARRVGKSPTTISREVKKHLTNKRSARQNIEIRRYAYYRQAMPEIDKGTVCM